MGGPERGYDGAKCLAERKRHLLVDTCGLVLGVRVHAANLHDRDGAWGLLTDEVKEDLPRPQLIWADGAYTKGFREWAEEERGWLVEVPYHPDRQLWRYGLEEKPRASSGVTAASAPAIASTSASFVRAAAIPDVILAGITPGLGSEAPTLFTKKLTEPGLYGQVWLERLSSCHTRSTAS